MGNGKFSAANTIAVTDAAGKTTEYSAPHIIVATGGRSRQLPNLPQDGKRIIGYREAMHLPTQPKSMLIVGSGAIGVEFAYFYHSIGTKVSIVEYMPQIVPVEDADISAELAKQYTAAGIDIYTNTNAEKVEITDKGCRVSLKANTDGKTTTIDCDMVLSAVGMTPNTENIGLETIGVQMDKGFINTNQRYQTNVKGVYAIGDVIKVNGAPHAALAHVASAEGILCVEHINGLHTEPIDYNNIPGCTYCQPEIASVGYTETKAIAAGYEVKVGKFPFSASGKAQAAGHSQGFVKVIYDAKYGEWLGAHMIGANVTEMIAEVVVARKLETTGHEIIKAVHPHPTMSEAIMEATASAYKEVIHL